MSSRWAATRLVSGRNQATESGCHAYACLRKHAHAPHSACLRERRHGTRSGRLFLRSQSEAGAAISTLERSEIASWAHSTSLRAGCTPPRTDIRLAPTRRFSVVQPPESCATNFRGAALHLSCRAERSAVETSGTANGAPSNRGQIHGDARYCVSTCARDDRKDLARHKTLSHAPESPGRIPVCICAGRGLQ